MNLPLPKGLHVERPAGDHNAGLWYDKFFHHWNSDFMSVPDAGKSEWVGEAARNKIGNAGQLQEQHDRLQRLMAVCGGHLLHFRTDGRFVTGLGREHPVENGFAWHHTLGVPYLPGSCVKGMLRAWAREQDIEPNVIARIFGPANQNNARVGSVVVGDALPIASVQLVAEVMTPHYGPYYQDEDAKTPPADWHDPIPIPFLAVDRGQTFVFTLAPTRANNAGDVRDCNSAFAWLSEALTWLGAGAKTAVGYGRFEADEQANQEAAAQALEERERQKQQAALTKRLQGLSPLAQELEHTIAERNLESDKNAFSAPPLIEAWLDKLEASSEADAVKRFAALIQIHFPGLLENPDRVRGKKHQPVFSDRQRKIAQRVRHLGKNA